MRSLDKHDLNLMRRVLKEGSVFFTRSGPEQRAFALAQDGILRKQTGVYRTTSGGKSTEFRDYYTITNHGRLALMSAERERAKE